MVQRFLGHVEFPTTTDRLIEQARSEDVDPHVHRVLGLLPTRAFASQDDITVALAQLDAGE